MVCGRKYKDLIRDDERNRWWLHVVERHGIQYWHHIGLVWKGCFDLEPVVQASMSAGVDISIDVCAHGYIGTSRLYIRVHIVLSGLEQYQPGY